MGKPAQAGGGLATAAAAGGAVDHVANDGQARKKIVDEATNAVGGSSSTNAVSTPASTGGGEMVTGISPELLAMLFVVGTVIVVVASKYGNN